MKKGLKTALITGASSGIGYELTKLFAADGHHLVLVARDRQKLNQAAEELKAEFPVTVRILSKDLSAPFSPEEIFHEVQKESLTIDVLVNNAGYGVHGLFSGTDLATELGMMQVNMAALTHLTKLFLKGMLERGEGKILNVASTAAFFPGGPLMAVYYATKTYVLSFSQALTEELRGTGVSVTALCPGPTESEFFKRAGTEKRIILSRFKMDTKKVALAGYQGLMKRKAVVTPGLINQLIVFGSRFLPRNLLLRIIRKFQLIQ